MIRSRLISCLQSRAFAVVGYTVLAILASLYLYFKFIDKAYPSGELNVSCFVYRDVNRNGIYDLGDRPYAGLRIDMARPFWGRISASSNISGFTNFTMKRYSLGADIRTTGSYTITAIPPSEWKVTSGNAVQTVSFKRLEGSPAGMAAEQLFVPVGVAPDLTLSGTVEINPSASPGTVGTLQAISPRGERVDLPLSPSGQFSFPAEAGDWRLQHTKASGVSVTRTVIVRDYAVVVSKIAAGPVIPAKLVRQKVDFDTLTPSDTLYEIPRGYAGFHWKNWVATHQKFYKENSPVNGAVSSEYLAYNSSGHPAEIWSDQPFDLAGVYLTLAWSKAEKHDVVIKAWRNDHLEYEDRFRARTAGPIYFDADFRSVTRIEFSSSAFWQILIDDLEVRRD